MFAYNNDIKSTNEFTINGETRIVNEGDSLSMDSDEEHGVKCLKEGVLVDVFNPKRDDFLKI